MAACSDGAALAVGSVAQRLCDAETRPATLDALDSALEGPVDHALSLTVAPVLCELLTAHAAEVCQKQFDHIASLLGRLCEGA